MKANELQIEDWVTGKKWRENPFKLTRINDNGKYYYGITSDGNQVGPFLIEEIEPIPLTPEILKKNGFEYYHKNFASLSYDHQFKLKMEKWPDENGLGGLWSITDLIKIRYFHQLQHALRLCGIKKELIL